MVVLGDAAVACDAATAPVAIARPTMAAATRRGREGVTGCAFRGGVDPLKASPAYAVAVSLAVPARREASFTASATAGTSRLLNTDGTM